MYILHGEIDAVRLLVNGDHVALCRGKPLVYLGEGLHVLFFIVSYCSEKRRFLHFPSYRTYQQTSGNENISRYLTFYREKAHSRDEPSSQRRPKQGACHRLTRPRSRSRQHRLY